MDNKINANRPEQNGGRPQLRVASAPRSMQPGGFWRRFLAGMIDGFAISIARFIFAFAVGLITQIALRGKISDTVQIANAISVLLNIPIFFGYYCWFYKHRGATPGKSVMGLEVIDMKTGAYMSYRQTIKREFGGKVLCMLTFGIGFLMVAFRQDKRGLHDIIANTQVVKID